MRATVMYAAGDVRVEDVPDAKLVEPTDIDGVPDGYRAMNERESLKVLIEL